MVGRSLYLVLVGVTVLPEPQSEELLVNVLRLLPPPMPFFVCIRNPVPAHSGSELF